MLPIVGAILSPLVKSLFENGLGLLGNAVLAKGKEAVEEAIGVKLPDEDKPLTFEQLKALRELEFAHEALLLDLGIKKQQVELEIEKVAQSAVTERWKADILSDSWLSKNIRPIALIHTFAVLDIMLLFAVFGKPAPAAYLALVGQLLGVMIAAYFVGRSVEKGIDLYQGWKQTQGH